MYFITTISLKFVPISESRDDDGIFRKPPSLLRRSLVYHAFSDVYIIREIKLEINYYELRLKPIILFISASTTLICSEKLENSRTLSTLNSFKQLSAMCDGGCYHVNGHTRQPVTAILPSQCLPC